MKRRKPLTKQSKKPSKDELARINLPDKQFLDTNKQQNINIYTEMNNIDNLIKEHKRQIIKNKFDYLFGYQNKSDTTQRFEKLKQILVNEVRNYKILLEKYENITTDRDVLILKQKLDELVKEFKELILKYHSANDIMLIKDAINIYMNNKTNIYDIANNIRTTKYIDNYIHRDPENKNAPDLRSLIQNKYTLSQLFINRGQLS